MWFSQISSPVFASSACRMFSGFTRYMMPLCTSGIGWFAPPSCIAHDPRELQVLHVGARDLVERAVAPALIVAAHHQPVARIGIAQHRVGDRRVVLHLAGDGEASRRRCAAPESATAAATGVGVVSITAPASARRRPRPAPPGPCPRAPAPWPRPPAAGPPGRRRARGRSRCSRWPLSVAGENACAPGSRAVRLQDERDDRCVVVRAQRGSAGRHRRRHVVEQVARRSPAPRVHEVRAGERRRFISAAEIRQVAATRSSLDRSRGRPRPARR